MNDGLNHADRAVACKRRKALLDGRLAPDHPVLFWNIAPGAESAAGGDNDGCDQGGHAGEVQKVKLEPAFSASRQPRKPDFWGHKRRF
jgi:hypothetical protein